MTSRAPEATAQAATSNCAAGVLYSALVARLLQPTLCLLRHATVAAQQQGPVGGGGGGGAGAQHPAHLSGRAGAALLRLLGSVIEVLGLELGAAGLEQLLGSLVEIYSAGGEAALVGQALGGGLPHFM